MPKVVKKVVTGVLIAAALASLFIPGFNVLVVNVGLSVGFGVGQSLAAISAIQVAGALSALSAAAGALAKNPQIGNIATTSGFSEEIRTPATPRLIGIGKNRGAGSLVYGHSSGEDNKFVHLVFVMPAHEIEAFDAFYLGDELVTLDGSGFVTQSRWKNSGGSSMVRILTRTGAPGQTAITELVSETDMVSADVFDGLAYMYVRYEFDEDVFQNGRPLLNAVYRGAKVYDPRLDSTVPGGSGTHRESDATTWEYSNNWALGVYHYARMAEPMGPEILNAEINVAAVIAAANVSDETVALKAGGTQKRYTMDGQFFVTPDWQGMIEQMRPSGAGDWIWQAGQYHIYAGADRSVALSFDENDLAGPVTYVAKARSRERFNEISGRFLDDTGDKYIQDTYPIYKDATAKTEDNNRASRLSLDLPFTSDNIRAQRIARTILAESRQQALMQMPVNLKGWQAKAMSIVQVSRARWSMTNKLFRVIVWSLDSSGAVGLTLKEYDPAVYTWAPATDETDMPASATPTLEDGTTTIGVAGLAAVEITLTSPDGNTAPAIEVTWDVPSQIVDFTVVQFRATGAANWITVSSEPEKANARVVISAVVPGETYDVQVFHVTNFGVFGTKAQVNAILLASGTAAIPWDDVASRPTELTDGRVSAGLDPIGNINRNITDARKTSSNILKRTGGGSYSGDLAAKVGAIWGSTLTGRPAELTDGRVSAGLDGSGDLVRNVKANRVVLASITDGIIEASKLKTDLGVDLNSVVPGVFNVQSDETDATLITHLVAEIGTEKFWAWTTAFESDQHRVTLILANFQFRRLNGANVNTWCKLYRRVNGGTPVQVGSTFMQFAGTSFVTGTILIDTIDTSVTGTVEYRLGVTLMAGSGDLESKNGHIQLEAIFFK